MQIKDYNTYTESQILPLYEAVGWTNYTRNPAMIKAAFRGSLLVLGAWDGEKLVGFLRAVGDGASILYIQDIVVHPNFQRHGIGTALLKEALARYPQVYQTVLLTDNTPKTIAFYESCGFTAGSKWNCESFLRVV